MFGKCKGYSFLEVVHVLTCLNTHKPKWYKSASKFITPVHRDINVFDTFLVSQKVRQKKKKPHTVCANEKHKGEGVKSLNVLIIFSGAK